MTAPTGSRGEPAAAGALATIEQLEWGKFTASEDGGVLAGEHDVLGMSPDFPRTLAPLCEPGVLGVARDHLEETNESLFAVTTHATVLRPVQPEGQRFIVLHRVGVRSEGGEGAPQRRNYALARYLVDRSGHVSPEMLFAAMRPLRGVTRDQAASLASLAVPMDGPSREGADVAPAFVEQALTFLISGVPIHVAAKERVFFAHVAAVWRSLPPELRGLLSAGWNVSSSVAETLAVSCCATPPAACARYDGRWTAPAATHRGRTASLLAGRLFVAMRSNTPEHVKALIAEIDDTSCPVSAPAAPQSPVLSFADPWVAAQFERAGRARVGGDVLGRLRRWMLRGDGAEERQIPALIAWLPEPADAVPIAQTGRQSPDARTKMRADRLLLAIVTAPAAPPLVPMSDEQDAMFVRGALLRDAFAAPDQAVASLLRAAHQGVAADLPPEVVASLERALDAHAATASTHLALLDHASGLEVYDGWLKRRGFDVALTLAASDDAGATRCLQVLRAWSVDASRGGFAALGAIASVVEMRSGGLPTPVDRAALDRLAETDRVRVGSLIERLWRNSAALGLERDVLLEWSSATRLPHTHFGVAIRVARGDEPSVADIRAEIEGPEGLAAQPRRVLDALSAGALRHLEEVRRDLALAPAKWGPLVRLWPEDVRLAIAAWTPAADERAVPPTTPMPSFVPSWELTQALIEEWMLTTAPERLALLPRVGPILWRWCAGLSARPAAEVFAADICRGLTRGCLPDRRDLAQTVPDQLSLAIMLARASGEYGLIAGRAPLLWSAAQEGWQIRLLLDLLPRENLRPAEPQLVALLRHRPWLRRHLARHDIHPDRVDHFDIASREFGELSASRLERVHRPEPFRDSVLSGAFGSGGVSWAGRLRLLSRAIQAYGEEPRDEAACCLRAVEDAGSVRDEVVGEICRTFVFGWADAALIDGDSLERLLSALAGRTRTANADFRVTARPAPRPLQLEGRTIVVADYALPLLWRLTRSDVVSEVSSLVIHRYRSARR